MNITLTKKEVMQLVEIALRNYGHSAYRLGDFRNLVQFLYELAQRDNEMQEIFKQAEERRLQKCN